MTLRKLYVFLLVNVVISCTVDVGNQVYDLSSISKTVYTVQGPSSEDNMASYEASICEDLVYCTLYVNGSLVYRNENAECYQYGSWRRAKNLKTENGFRASFESVQWCPPKYTSILQSEFNMLCDTSAGAIGLLKANKVGDDDCSLSVDVHTNLVCKGSIPINSFSVLSGSFIFLIILFSLIVAYLIVGFGYNYYKDKAIAMPQQSFWCTKLPYWTKTGCILSGVTTVTFCKVSYRWCCLKISRARPGDDQMEAGLVEES